MFFKGYIFLEAKMTYLMPTQILYLKVYFIDMYTVNKKKKH